MPPHSDPTLEADPAPLLSRMEEEMALRGFARATKRLYLAHVRRFLKGRTREPAPDQEVRRWLLSLIEAGHSHTYVGQALSALRFLYVHVLDQPAPVMHVPRPKKKRQLPRVLTAPVVKRFLEALETPKHRAIAFGLANELAALGSLALGARLKAGSTTRRFEPEGDARGQPVDCSIAPDPVLPPAHMGVLVRSARGTKALADLEPVKQLPTMSAEDATVLVKGSRLYQDALWVADVEPHLAWILLVSAVEAAAGHWREEDLSPLDRMLAWGPGAKLNELLSERCSDLIEGVAEHVAPYVGATRAFVDFLIEFLPDPPSLRPMEAGQHSWSELDMRASLKKIYAHRSGALHAGRRFPAPMCQPAIKAEGWPTVSEVPTGTASSTLGGTWLKKDTPMHLHVFQHIARGALLKWWRSIA